MTRLLDIFFSLIALIALMPIFLVLIPLLRLTGEGKVFYRQERVGASGRLFYVLKFATMLENSPNIGSGTITIDNDPRILPMGHFLRRSKINELPQIINILVGDMSLIGPRPLTPDNFAFYSTEQQKAITQVRPGLSGLASIFFRNEDKYLTRASDPRVFYRQIITPMKGNLEVWYVERNNISMYFILITFTILVVLRPSSLRYLPRIYPDLSTFFEKINDI